MFVPWKKSFDQPRQHIKKQRRYFANKGPSSQRYGFSSSHVWMWELDYTESLEPKKTDALTCGVGKDSWESLDCKEIQPVNAKGNSVQFSRSVTSNSLRPHESQHTRPHCPSPTPGVHSDSRPSSQWCHPAISSSVVPFSSCLESFPASGSFPVSQFFVLGG